VAVENVRPTRLELLRTRRRIVVAKRGLNLLKLKRTALIAEFFRISKETMRLRENLREKIVRGYDAIRLAETLEGPTRLENISMMLPELPTVAVATRNVMGVRTPQVANGRFHRIPAPALLDLPTSIGEAIPRFQEIFEVVLDIAEKENALRRLLREIEKTKRRASAIENVLIPRLDGIVRYIKFRFDEMERDSFSMLKTVKRKLDQETEGVAT
jgi:V/A-type H+/Na+-transporting ATPase subunit D